MSDSRSRAAPARPLAVVTGASSGIGRDLALELARWGHDLVVVARRRDLLDTLAAEIARDHGVTCEAFDVDLATAEGCERLVAHLEPHRARLDVFVNNAGIGSHGFFHTTSLERERQLIALNVEALTHLTKRVLPWMLERHAGRIVNVASVASFQPGPLMAVYYASKAYVLSLSEALANECLGTGVTVTAVCPGPTTTEFQQAAGIRKGARAGGAPAMTSRAVAELAYRGIMQGKPVVLTGARNKLAAFFGRHFPRGIVSRAVRKIQEARLP
jgi:uncharacterized protein